MPKVAVVKCEAYEPEKVYRAVALAVELAGGLKDVVKAGDTVLLKVNLLSALPPGMAVTTHPLVIGAVARLFRDTGTSVWVGDAAATGGLRGEFSETDPFGVCGIRKAAEREKAEIVNFNRTGYQKVKVPHPKRLREINLARPVAEADKVVSLPKLKTHELTLLTGAVKNFFGCVPHSDRSTAHSFAKPEQFAQAVVDIYSVCRPSFAVMDAVIAMDKEGPSRGRPFPLGLILASHDCVSLDIVASQITGFDPTDILTSVDAMERGLGPPSVEEIEVVGEELKDVIRRDFQKPSTYTGAAYRGLRRLLTPIGLKLLQSYPRIEMSRCHRCGLCAEKCPAGAITINRYPRIDYRKCIQCFTCYEFCPAGAVRVRRSWLAEQLLRK